MVLKPGHFGKEIRNPRKGLKHVLEKEADQLDRSLRDEDAVHRVETEKNILQTVKRRKGNWIGHILRKNCFLRHVINIIIIIIIIINLSGSWATC